MTQQIPYQIERRPEEEMDQRAEAFFQELDGRRSVRFFSDEPVPRRYIEWAIRAASTAPSGAHMQPWTFVAVNNREIQRAIRQAAEEEERANYEARFPEEWKEALRPIGTDWEKPFLEHAPWLVVVFAQRHGLNDDGSKRKHYYVQESVGIACGLFIASLNHMGLATLTHTPSPMGFLSRILRRPDHERPYILFPVGYPTVDCTVPDLNRKSLDEVAVWLAD